MKTYIKTLTAAALCVLGLSTVNFKPAGLQPGDAAKEFKLENIDGTQVSLASLTDAKGCILVFTCNHCPFSKMYENRIVQLDSMYKAKGYPVVAINPNDTAQYPEDGMEAMKVRAAEKGFTFPYLRDESQEIAAAYGAEKTPHVYVLQKVSGTFTVKYVGAIDNNPKDANAVTDRYMQRAVNELLEGKPVSLTSTKAIGCGIKWK